MVTLKLKRPMAAKRTPNGQSQDRYTAMMWRLARTERTMRAEHVWAGRGRVKWFVSAFGDLYRVDRGI